jgi:hypothetical protein
MSSEAQNNSATDVSRLNPQKAVWIASYPKSGNTWVRVFLHNLMRELRGEIDAVQNINALHEWTDRESLAVRFARHFGKSPDALSSREISEIMERDEHTKSLPHLRVEQCYSCKTGQTFLDDRHVEHCLENGRHIG